MKQGSDAGRQRSEKIVSVRTGNQRFHLENILAARQGHKRRGAASEALEQNVPRSGGLLPLCAGCPCKRQREEV